MRICLVRHGPAGERGPEWPDDRLRPLTPKGKRQFERAAIGLHAIFAPTLIVSSPYTRAAQTAEILQREYSLQGIHFSDTLTGDDHEALLRELGRLGHADIAAVGHMPSLLETLSLLVTGHTNGLRAEYEKGGAALVECPGVPSPGAGTLGCMVQPNALRAIGRAGRDSHR